MLKKGTSFLLSIFLIVGVVYSDTIKKTGQAGMTFLDIGVGGRNMAMGDAYCPRRPDASALFYNPAGITWIGKRDLFISHTKWLADISHNSAALTLDLGFIGTLGFSLVYMDYGNFVGAKIDINPDGQGYVKTGDFTVGEWAVGIAYGRQIMDRFSLGGQIKWVHQDLGSHPVFRVVEGLPDYQSPYDYHAKKNIPVFDYGTIYNTGYRDIYLSFYIRNFTPEVTYIREQFDLPLTFNLGISTELFKFLGLQHEEQSLDFIVEAVNPRDWSERMRIGLEYCFADFLYLRAGYKLDYSVEGLTGGLGFRWQSGFGIFYFDYAYKPINGVFNDVHVLTLRYHF